MNEEREEAGGSGNQDRGGIWRELCMVIDGNWMGNNWIHIRGWEAHGGMMRERERCGQQGGALYSIWTLFI